METQTPDWIVALNGGRFYVLDNESLKQDGIIAHAIHSVFDNCKDAKELQSKLNRGEYPARIK